jgi:hypothetical protein
MIMCQVNWISRDDEDIKGKNVIKGQHVRYGGFTYLDFSVFHEFFMAGTSGIRKAAKVTTVVYVIKAQWCLWWKEFGNILY